jgi:predicted nucleotidyltransferase
MNGLAPNTVLVIQEVFQKYPEVERAVLYGSRALGTFREGSDIDLTLFGSNLDLTLLQRIENELEDLNLPYKFDLSIFHQISHAGLIDHIARVGVVFYERK